MSADSKYTATPWRLDEGSAIVGTWEGGEVVTVCSMNRTHWSHPCTGGPDKEVYRKNDRMARETVANAHLIVSAVNEREGLLAVLERGLALSTATCLALGHAIGLCGCAQHEWRGLARAALRKAEEVPCQK